MRGVLPDHYTIRHSYTQCEIKEAVLYTMLIPQSTIIHEVFIVFNYYCVEISLWGNLIVNSKDKNKSVRLIVSCLYKSLPYFDSGLIEVYVNIMLLNKLIRIIAIS